MFFVTGDIHGDIKDFNARKFRHLKKNDCIIICGDFGFIWNDSETENRALKYLGKKKQNILFVDGAHENFDLLSKYPVCDWNGGKAQIINGNLVHLMRGQVYNINGKKIFAFGGGESSDREMRREHESWWREEMPSMDEMKTGVDNLLSNGWQVDYIITHEAPSDLKRYIAGKDGLNGLNVYLDEIKKRCKYKKWIFGMYHRNKRISPLHEAVFDSVVELE